MYLGGAAFGNSVTAGSVAFNGVHGLGIDCVRKSVFVTEVEGQIVKEVKLGSLVTTRVAGGCVTCTAGPGPTLAADYGISYSAEARTFQDELYIASFYLNEIVTVGMSTMVNDPVACIAKTWTATVWPTTTDQHGDGKRYFCW